MVEHNFAEKVARSVPSFSQVGPFAFPDGLAGERVPPFCFIQSQKLLQGNSTTHDVGRSLRSCDRASRMSRVCVSGRRKS